jgi:hypothetical protein
MIRHLSPTGIAILLVLAATIVAAAQRQQCGMHRGDWCPAPPGDLCGRHRDTASCKADPTCYGVPYRGESFAACVFDNRGFAFNCPTVGCTSRPSARPGNIGGNSPTAPQ